VGEDRVPLEAGHDTRAARFSNLRFLLARELAAWSSLAESPCRAASAYCGDAWLALDDALLTGALVSCADAAT
jgi:hypothetical protein